MPMLPMASCERGSTSTETSKEVAATPAGAAAYPFAIVKRPDPRKSLKRPKAILFIIIDTLRADHLGCYGSTLGLTPNLDSIAKYSIVFENAMATSSWTRASVASMYTSRYPTSNGCLTREDLLAEDAVTLAEELARLGGYKCIGIYGNGNAGWDMGFDQGFMWYRTPPIHEQRKYESDPPDALKFPADSITRHALKALQQKSEGNYRDRPVMLVTHYVDPHDPYLPHPGLLNEPEPAGRWSGSRTNLLEMDRMSHALTEMDKERIRFLYRGEVKYCDAAVGELLHNLSAIMDLAKDTMIVVTSDHGEGLWDHGFRDHGTDLFEEQVRVPLLIHWPGMTANDARIISEPVSLVDIAPTILAAAGLDSPPEFQGADLSPWRTAPPLSPKNGFVFTEMNLDEKNFEALRSARYKLVRNRSMELGASRSFQLFDLVSDPKEMVNLLETSGDLQPEAAKVLEQHQELLWTWSSAVLEAAGDEVERKHLDLAELDPTTLQLLRGLGYISATEFENAKQSSNKSKGSGDGK
ncbi:MAG: sulfatase [Planctomycetes bacterium]|nr:sulfatase [Planctomycetota bacterium]